MTLYKRFMGGERCDKGTMYCTIPWLESILVVPQSEFPGGALHPGLVAGGRAAPQPSLHLVGHLSPTKPLARSDGRWAKSGGRQAQLGYNIV